MNHLTTEPIESQTGDGAAVPNGTSIAEKPESSTTFETVAVSQPNKTRPTYVPPLDPAVGIELRITRAGSPARRLRINSTRCTLGSGEGCTVRLSDASLRPLHAVILRDVGRIMIRGYSVPLEINGQHLVESVLSLGDVVRMGQYCFELIDLPITDNHEGEGEGETVETPAHRSRNASVENPVYDERTGRDAAIQHIATEESPACDLATDPKRLTFSQPASTSLKTASRPSISQSVLEGLQVSQVSGHISGRNDDLFVEEILLREPVTSLAQIHVHAERNSELMADLAAARQREQEANEKLASTVDQLEVARAEISHAVQTADALNAKIAGLSDQVLKLANDAKEQESIAAAEKAKLNRTLESLRESGAASQKAEAATRQALQELIRQRDEALGQRAVAIDDEQMTRAKLVEAEAKILRLNQQAEENANVLTKFEAETDQARARTDELRDVCNGQADQIVKLSNALEMSRSSELETATRLKSTVEQLQAELNASHQLVRNADEERVQLDTLQATLDSTLREHLAEKLSWDAHLAGMHQKIEQLSVELKNTTDELSHSRSEATSLQSQVSEMRSQVANVEAEMSLRPTVNHLEEVRLQLAQSESDYQNVVEQLAQLREDYDLLTRQRVAGQPIAAAQAMQPSAPAASLPLALLPVPAVVAKDGIPFRPETESQWLTSSHTRTEVMRDADEEESLHTEPMNRFSGESFLAAENVQPHDDSHLAAMIQRPEGTTSDWFADYTVKQSGDEEPAELEDADDNAAVLDGLSHCVRENDTPEDDIDAAIDENQHDELSLEASALSLTRMLINELDSVNASDRDSALGYGVPDPMVNSKRLVSASVTEEGISSDDYTNEEDEESLHVEVRRKHFDERAFRDSFSGSAGDDVIDPNTDEAAYAAQAESAEEPACRSTTSSHAVKEQEEDSVESYMNQLLRRMGQEPLPTPAVVKPTPSSVNKIAPSQSSQTTSEMPEVIRSNRATPELRVPMDQMRELANQSAESAISTSNRKGANELRSKALLDGAQAGIVVVCALVFFYCGMTSSNLKLVWNTSGALALSLSVFFLYEMFRKLTTASIKS